MSHPRLSALAVAMAAACAEKVEQIPDGQYRVAVVQTRNTCSNDLVGDGAPGLTTRLDLFRRSDGRYDLHWLDGWVPGDFAFTGIELGGGLVHGAGTGSEVVGSVSADAVDLELVYRGVRIDNGQPCERRLTARGGKRPMFSPSSVDGRYIVSLENRGGACADGTVIPATGAWNMRMEVLPFRDDRTSVLIEDLEGGLIRFWIEPIGGGGNVHLTHDVFFSGSPDSLTPLDGTVEGAIESDRIALTAQIFAKDDPRACTTTYAITGSRWLPSASSIDAEYRTTYRMTDSCDPTYDARSEDAAFAVAEAGGKLDLIDSPIQSTVSFDGANVCGDSSLVYRGTVTPDHTAYFVEDHYTSGGIACVFSLAVDGTARYRGL